MLENATPNLRNFILCLIAGTVLAACGNTPPSFANMSEEELAAYNQTQPLEKMIHCVQEAQTSTYIRKKICRTVMEWVRHNERQAMALDVLNSPAGFGFPDRGAIRDGPG